MAIEFNCPYCSAVIRVPDSAAGGKGKCPRCVKRITVPKVSSRTDPKPPAPELEFLMAAPAVEADPADRSVAPVAGDPNEIEFEGVDEGPVVDPFAPAPAFPAAYPVEPVRQPLPPTSVARRLKQKKSGAWGIPALFGLLFCVGLGWYFWQNSQPLALVGDVQAETAAELKLPPGEVDRNLCRQPPGELQEILDTLQKSPVRIPSTLMLIQISANPRGLTFELGAGPQTQFYKVNLGDVPALAAYRKDHTFELEQARSDEIERSATVFIDSYRLVRKKEASASSLSDFRNSLALPALVRGLGHQLVAEYNGTAYPCVYEDQDSHVYFLLPPGAASFDVAGRKHQGKVLFPGRFRVKVTGTLQPETQAPAPDKEKPAAMPETHSDEESKSTDAESMKADP